MSDDSAWRILRDQLCGNSKPPDAEAIGVSNGGRARVYVSFDIDHDRELYERLVAQAQGSGFCVSGRSELASSHEHWTELARRRIREADQMIVICGEHSDASLGMSAEIRIAQEEKTPYFLLWGRRTETCAKPIGARPAEGMYKWTPEILADQVAIAPRRAHALAMGDPPRDRARQP
jgi:hypothetical protein